jgi:hypothetical protein
VWDDFRDWSVRGLSLAVQRYLQLPRTSNPNPRAAVPVFNEQGMENRRAVHELDSATHGLPF